MKYQGARVYKRDFDVLLQKGTIPGSILLYGESSFLIHYYGAKVIEALGISKEERTPFYFSEHDSATVRSILAQQSLFGDRSFVQLKLDKKLSGGELEAIIALTEKNPYAYLLIEFYHSEARSAAEYSRDSRAMASSFKGKNHAEVRFFAPTHSEAMSLLRNRAKELALNVEEHWLSSLLSMQNQDIALAYNELEKFTLLPEAPTIRDLERLSYGFGSANIQELCESLASRKEDSLKIALAIENEGIDEMSVIMEVERFFFQLFLFYAHIRVHGNSNSTEILGYKLPKAIEEKRASMAIRLKEGHYFKILTALQRRRTGILQGCSKGSGISTLLIKLQAILR